MNETELQPFEGQLEEMSASEEGVRKEECSGRRPTEASQENEVQPEPGRGCTPEGARGRKPRLGTTS